MQEITKEILIKSLSFNIFYPRDLDNFNDKIIKFSYSLNDLSDAFITNYHEELGYARRYTKKYLFFFSKNLDEEEIIKASIYGADGIIVDKFDNKKTINMARNSGLHTAFIAKSNADLLKAILYNFNIIIANRKILENVPKNKLKGEINETSKSTLA